MLARFGDDTLTALTWAARQQRIVVTTCVASQSNRMVSWTTVFGEQAGEDEIENIDDLVGKFYAYLVSFTTDAANRIVRNSGEGNGLEAWRRPHSEHDPTSSMRRAAILQQVQNPPRCQRVEDLGVALEDYDSLVAAMFRLMPKSLEETVMFANEDEGFQELYDRLLAYSRTKQSIQKSESKKSTKKDDPMDVDALNKGAGKGKSKGKGNKTVDPKERKQEKHKERRSDGRRCAEQRRRKRKVERKRQKEQRQRLMHGLGKVANKLMGGGKRQIVRQNLVQDGGRRQTIGHHGNQKQQWVKLRSTAWKAQLGSTA